MSLPLFSPSPPHSDEYERGTTIPSPPFFSRPEKPFPASSLILNAVVDHSLPGHGGAARRFGGLVASKSKLKVSFSFPPRHSRPQEIFTPPFSLHPLGMTYAAFSPPLMSEEKIMYQLPPPPLFVRLGRPLLRPFASTPFLSLFLFELPRSRRIVRFFVFPSSAPPDPRDHAIFLFLLFPLRTTRPSQPDADRLLNPVPTPGRGVRRAHEDGLLRRLSPRSASLAQLRHLYFLFLISLL